MKSTYGIKNTINIVKIFTYVYLQDKEDFRKVITEKLYCYCCALSVILN